MALVGEKRAEWIASQQEREAAARQALTDGVKAMTQRQGWQEWLGLAARLPHYSVGNQLLLMAQMPQARMVMSADQWRKVGRWPARGSTALRIWAPSNRRSDRSTHEKSPARADAASKDLHPADHQEPRQRDVEGDARQDGQSRRGFLLVPVFDVSQTDGAPLPEQPKPIRPPDGLAPAGMWDALVDYAQGAGFPVSFGDCGPADGVTNFATRTITVADRGSDLARALTLAHEIGHMSLHGHPSIGDMHRGRAEVQAESVAYLVAAEYELTQAADWHFDYIAQWAAKVGGADVDKVVSAELLETATGVLSAARPLLEHLAEACVGHPDPMGRSFAPPAPVVREVAR